MISNRKVLLSVFDVNSLKKAKKLEKNSKKKLPKNKLCVKKHNFSENGRNNSIYSNVQSSQNLIICPQLL